MFNLSSVSDYFYEDRANERLAVQVSSDETAHLAIVVIFTSLSCILFLLSTICNMLFLIIYLRKSSLRNISNKFIASLTLSNLVSSWSLLPSILVDYFVATIANNDGTLGFYLCPSFHFIGDFTTTASICATVLIALDRFFAITDPLHYHMLITKWRSSLLIGFGWILAGLIGGISAWTNSETGSWNACAMRGSFYISLGPVLFSCFNFAFTFLLPFITLSWTYSKIYHAAQQNSERTRRSSLCTPTLEVVDIPKHISRSSSTRSTSSQIVSTIRRRISNASLFLYKEEARAAKISFVVITLFLICWLPYYSIHVLSSVFGQEFVSKDIHTLAYLFALSNSVSSPYVYIFRSKRIKREVLRFLRISSRGGRREIERRRLTYHQLPSSMLKVPSSSSCLEGNLCSSSTTEEVVGKQGVYSLAKILHPVFLSPDSCNFSLAFSTNVSACGSAASAAPSTTGSLDSLPNKKTIYE